MANSSDIDDALVAKLQADSDLTALCPDGVFWEEAPAGAKRFVIVSMVTETDGPVFGERGYEDTLYLVKAVMLKSALGDPKAAANRIDALLEQGTLTATGYSLMAMSRESRVRYTEVDDIDTSIRWFHRGGRYQVVMST